MKLSLDKIYFLNYLRTQINNFYPDYNIISNNCLDKYFDDTVYRTTKCFEKINKPYYNYKNELNFNHLHSDHYSMFLYILSNTIWQIDKNETLASKIFLLNKALHGIDAFYSVSLPEVFLFVHPVGTILGNAKYSNYFAVYQNCTIGATSDNKYPSFSNETLIYSNSSIIGDCKVGNNVVFSANSSLISTNIDNNKLILGNYPNNRIIDNKENVIDRIFK